MALTEVIRDLLYDAAHLMRQVLKSITRKEFYTGSPILL